MAKKITNYAVSFAARYADPVGGWLCAGAALSRLEMLLEDARQINEHFNTVMPPTSRWAPWFGADIISYYSVGYVTCLEWHARSRLVDLLSYKPGAIEPNDVKQLRDAVVIEMNSANVTVAAMIGANTNVSSFKAYMNIFSRVLNSLKISNDSYQSLKKEQPKSTMKWVSTGEFADLENLYDFRNHLVHEIDITTLGHQNVREAWSPEEAIRIGDIVLRLIKGLESDLTLFAPADFPNLLDAEWYPVSPYEVLLADLPKLEKRIDDLIREHKEGFDHIENEDFVRDWVAAKEAASHHLNAEDRFLDETLLLHFQYLDLRGPLKTALVKARHMYLSSIIRVVEGVWTDEL